VQNASKTERVLYTLRHNYVLLVALINAALIYRTFISVKCQFVPRLN